MVDNNMRHCAERDSFADSRLMECLASRQIFPRAVPLPAQVLVQRSRITGHEPRTAESLRRLEGHPHRQYNPLFALRGGIRHGHC